MIDLKNLIKLTEARARLYRFLSSIYLQVPNSDFVERLTSENHGSFLICVISSVTEIHALKGIRDGLEVIEDHIKDSKDKPIEKLREDLAVAYTRLFRGIKRDYGPPPPYESVYKEGRMVGNSALAVLRKYREVHLNLLDKHKGVLPDHIGVELNFMHFLCSKEMEAFKNEDQAGALRFLRMQKEFLEKHIMRWFPKFHSAVESHYEKNNGIANFYLGAVKITDSFIGLDYDLLCTIIKELNKK